MRLATGGALKHGVSTMGLGTGEYIALAFILFFIFSASRMGQLGNAIGKFVYSFKKASKGEGFVDVKPAKTLSRTRTEDAEIVEDTEPKKRS